MRSKREIAIINLISAAQGAVNVSEFNSNEEPEEKVEKYEARIRELRERLNELTELEKE